jgi:hypothetical protein
LKKLTKANADFARANLTTMETFSSIMKDGINKYTENAKQSAA